LCYILVEYDTCRFLFLIEYEGGYNCVKREFSDLETLKYYCEKICDILELQYKATAIHNHLVDDKEVNREVNLEKLL